jgi:hypothetical protein
MEIHHVAPIRLFVAAAEQPELHGSDPARAVFVYGDDGSDPVPAASPGLRTAFARRNQRDVLPQAWCHRRNAAQR